MKRAKRLNVCSSSAASGVLGRAEGIAAPRLDLLLL